MAALGFSLNNLTLFGLVLAIGIVVDDAIVVLENIERLIAKGLRRRARRRSRRWRRSPGRSWRSRWCSSSVFVPCCFISGITGQFFRQFAVTIAVSTIISAVNALTMTPSRAVLIFKTRGGRATATSSSGRRCRGGPSAILGGLLTLWLRAEPTWTAGWACAPRRTGHGRGGGRGLAHLGDRPRPISSPGASVGRADRLADHPAGERRAGLVVPRLQPRSSTG